MANRFPSFSFLLGALCLLPHHSPQAARIDKPNFVIINIDDLGYADLEPYGSTLNRTPHLSRMAAEGRKLTSFYAAPVCTPSRSSLMTGCYPKRVGLPNVLFPGNAIGLNASESTLPELLKDRGYATACIGKWHLGDQPEFLPTRHGFDYYFGIPYSNDMGPVGDGARSNLDEPLPSLEKIRENRPNFRDHPPLPLLRQETVIERVRGPEQTTVVKRYTEEAVKFIQSRRNEPFFLYLPHTAVHWPLYPGKEFQGKSKNGIYGDWVEELDWSAGQVLGTIRDLNLSERTLVFFTSDNGGTQRGRNTPLRGHKGSTWEGGMRTCTIAWWPGQIPAGTATDEIASMMDFLPTLVKLAGGTLPADRKLDGRDMGPLLHGTPGAKSAYDAFYYFRGERLHAVREGPWKLHIENKELYHLADDLAEAKNVAAQNHPVVARLEELAALARADLGDGQPGPGCREPGRVENGKFMIEPDGAVRAEFRGAAALP